MCQRGFELDRQPCKTQYDQIQSKLYSGINVGSTFIIFLFFPGPKALLKGPTFIIFMVFLIL